MARTIDLNADVGERPEALADGSEEAILRLVSSANIACGGHAGNEEMMEQVIRLCMKHGVAVGAHPGYPDRARFGREPLSSSPEAIQAFVFEQVKTLGEKAASLGTGVRHVKPHGALYNIAAHDRATAEAIAKGAARWRGDLTLVGLAGSLMLTVWTEMGFRTAGEAFADRAYESDGTLRSRKKENALITDPAQACRQALRIVRQRSVISTEGVEVPVDAKTLSVHSDTPQAASILLTLRGWLEKEGIGVKAFSG